MDESRVIVHCPKCGMPLVRPQRGIHDTFCGRCLYRFRIARGTIIRRVSRAVTDAEPGLISPGRYHRDEELRIDVGHDLPLVVPFKTLGPYDSTLFKEGDDVVVVGQLFAGGGGHILYVRELTSGVQHDLAAVSPHGEGCIFTGAGCVVGALLAFVIVIFATWAVAVVTFLAVWGLGILLDGVSWLREHRWRKRQGQDPMTRIRLSEQKALDGRWPADPSTDQDLRL